MESNAISKLFIGDKVDKSIRKIKKIVDNDVSNDEYVPIRKGHLVNLVKLIGAINVAEIKKAVSDDIFQFHEIDHNELMEYVDQYAIRGIAKFALDEKTFIRRSSHDGMFQAMEFSYYAGLLTPLIVSDDDYEEVES